MILLKETGMNRAIIKNAFLLLIFVLMSCSNESIYGSRFDQIQILDKPQEDKNLSTVPQEWIEAADITENMVAKAQDYRNATHDGQNLRNGIYVYSTTVEAYKSAPEKLAARIAVLGFRDVYLSCGKSMIAAADTWLRTFIATCTDYNIKVYALRIANVNMLISTDPVKEDTDLVKNYNYSVRTKEKFAGISADLEPHTAKGDNHPGSALPYTWDASTNFGVGRDNDNLLKRTLQAMECAANELHPSLYLNEAVAVSFQEYYNKGQLSYGSAPQFLQYCDYLVVMAYFATKEDIWNRSTPYLEAADKDKSISICVKTAKNNYATDSLQDKGWNNLLETMSWLKQQGLEYPSFRGLDVFTYEGLEIMWGWTTDNGN